MLVQKIFRTVRSLSNKGFSPISKYFQKIDAKDLPPLPKANAMLPPMEGPKVYTPVSVNTYKEVFGHYEKIEPRSN